MQSQQVYLTVSEVAERFAVNSNKVLKWISSGQMPAVDVSESKGERPRWRIHIDEVDRFELDRRSTPPPAPKPVRRKSKPNVIEFVK